jgi:DnaK suppressor protein
MIPKQLVDYHRRLLAQRDELLGKGPVKIDPNRTSDVDVGTHEDEQPLNEMLQSIASNRNRNADGLVRLINQAIGKLTHSPEDFGVCAECGEEIASARLEAMPWVQLCVDCQAKRDGPKRPSTRRSAWDVG